MMMMMMRASFSRVVRSSSSSYVGLFGTITKPRKNYNVQNLLQKRWLNSNTNIYSEKMEVGVNKLVHAVKGLVVPNKQDLVLISKNNGFSAIKEFQLELEDPEEKLDVIQLELEDPEEKLGVKIVEGMQFDDRFFASHFVEERPFDHENCKVLLVDKITNAMDLASVLKDAIKGGYPILIITFEVPEEAIDVFVASIWPLGEPKIAVLTTPKSWGSRGDYVDDIALLTGATIIKEEAGLTLENVGSHVLGFAAKVVVGNCTTTIISDGSRKESLNREAEKIREVVMMMTKVLEIDRWESSYKSIKDIYLAMQLMHEIERLDQRLVRLCGGVAVIEVGTETKKEVEEKKQRFDVSLDKIKMAFKKGIVAAGGCTFNNDKHKEAVEFVKTTLSYPIKHIAKNVGVDENVVVEKVISSDDPYYGYDVATKTSKDLKVANKRLTEAIKAFASHLIYLEDDRVKQLINLIDEISYVHIIG